MRSEREMFDLILDVARRDSRVLAVYMNGSRTNEAAPRDIFQDYDIVYVVREIQSFIDHRDWINVFGGILYMQRPDEFPDDERDSGRYAWLMQLTDGNRLDLTVQTLTYAKAHIHDDRLCKILLDKEGVLPKIPPSTDAGYHVKRPTELQFLACANEFWWCGNNLAKGLWREELPYVQDMAAAVVRKELERMLGWKVGIKTNFSVSLGKSAKYLYKWLEEGEYQQYLNTYFGGSTKEAWAAVLLMCDLFDETAKYVAQSLGYTYNIEEAAAARGFLEHVRRLPKDAAQVY